MLNSNSNESNSNVFATTKFFPTRPSEKWQLHLGRTTTPVTYESCLLNHFEQTIEIVLRLKKNVGSVCAMENKEKKHHKGRNKKMYIAKRHHQKKMSDTQMHQWHRCTKTGLTFILAMFVIVFGSMKNLFNTCISNDNRSALMLLLPSVSLDFRNHPFNFLADFEPLPEGNSA